MEENTATKFLLVQNQELREQRHGLTERISELEAANARLMAIVDICKEAVTAQKRLRDLSGPVHRIGLVLEALAGEVCNEFVSTLPVEPSSEPPPSWL